MCKKNCLGCQFFCVSHVHSYQGEQTSSLTKNKRGVIVKDHSFYVPKYGRVDHERQS